MSETFTDCPELTRVLDGAADPQHLVVCAECAGLADDLSSLQAQARALPRDGWAGSPCESVDVDAALAQVLGAARPRRSRSSRRAAVALRLLTSAAAALLLFSIGAPVFLRYRIEHGGSGSLSETTSGEPHPVWWTSQPSGQ